MDESVEETYYQRNRNVILNREKGYHKNDKERLKEQARDKYIELSEEDKDKKNMEETETIICLKKRNKN